MTIPFVNVLREAIVFCRAQKKQLAEDADVASVTLHNVLSGRTRRPQRHTARMLAKSVIAILCKEAERGNSGKCRTLIFELHKAYEDEYGDSI